MPWGLAAAAAVSAYSTHQSNKASSRAASAQQAGIANATGDVIAANNEAQGYLKPTVAQGDAAQDRLNSAAPAMYQAGGQGISTLQGQTGNLNVNQFLDPSAAYSMKQANQALQESAAARGGLLSGATLKALNTQSSQMAQQNYNNAAQLALSNRGQQINVGNSLVDVGQTGIQVDQGLNQLGTQGRFNQAQTASNLGQDLATLSQSSGNVAGANAANQRSVLGSAVTGAAQAYFSDEDLKKEVEAVTDAEIDEFLTKLNPAQYEYVEDAVEKGAPTGKQVGVMAQDVEKSKVGKRLVVEDQDGDKMLDVPKSVGALMASVASINHRLKKVEGKK